MSEVDARGLLVAAQTKLAQNQQEEAYRTFAEAAHAFAGPTRLLGGAHGWRGVAQIAIQRGEHLAADRALLLAEQTYTLGLELLVGAQDEASSAFRLDLTEGIATCKVMTADLQLRQGDYVNARRALDDAYPLYKGLGDRPSVSDLWTTTARLAEREGRWFSARTAWSQVLKVRRSNHDERGVCDALIRMSEAMLAEDDLEKASLRLDEAESLARELADPTLIGRVRIAIARKLELEHDWEAAWEKWLDAMESLKGADPILVGLSQVRMARTAVRVRKDQTAECLQNGLLSLLEGHYPDAVGLVLHQLAIVSLVTGEFEVALLAAAGASEARGAKDHSVDGVLFRCLVRFERLEAAYLLSCIRHLRHPDKEHNKSMLWLKERLDAAEVPLSMPDATDADALQTAFRAELLEAIRPLARAHGLPLDSIGTRRAALRLCDPPDTETSVPAVTLQPVRPVLTWVIREDEVERYPLSEGLNLLGRGPDNAVQMSWDPKASRTHCSLDYRGGREIYVKDLHSHHGVHLNGVRISDEVPLQEGQALRVGETDFLIKWAAQSDKAAVAIAAG